jgi:hypothetical protein
MTSQDKFCHDDCDALPDACGNDTRQEKLLDRQTRNENQSWIEYFLRRERYLLVSAVLLVVLMNISTGRYILYPFKIFSTWVHEMCHGLAAILGGGYIAKLRIYSNGSGSANTACKYPGWVASAGYPGTSVTGCLLLLFRRTTLGPTIGTIGLGIAMILSVILYVGNAWGRIVLSLEGAVLILCGWQLPAAWLDHLYNFLALTVSLNALETIQDLFGSNQGYVNGEIVYTDAHTVAQKWGGDYRTWATIWLTMSIVLTAFGILFAKDARALPWNGDGLIKDTSSAPAISSASGQKKTNVYSAKPSKLPNLPKFGRNKQDKIPTFTAQIV